MLGATARYDGRGWGRAVGAAGAVHGWPTPTDIHVLGESPAWLLRGGSGGAAVSSALLEAASKILFVRAGWVA